MLCRIARIETQDDVVDDNRELAGVLKAGVCVHPHGWILLRRDFAEFHSITLVWQPELILSVVVH